MITGQFQLNKHWPGHPLVCLETPLKSAFATRKYIFAVMISLILDKKIPHPVPKHLLIPLPGLQSNPISRLDCITKSPTIFWSNPGSRKYPSKLWGPESTLNTPSQSCAEEKFKGPVSRASVHDQTSHLGNGFQVKSPPVSRTLNLPSPPPPPTNHEIYIERCTRLLFQ